MSVASPTVAVSTVQPIAELFSGATTALWATTYNVDLSLVSEFLLNRLGEPPLNVVVLADHHRLSSSLARVPAERVDTLTTVNRRWLVRGVSAGAAFHPKTYLQVTYGRTKLLVGSGNLSTHGLDEGHEVFTVLTSGTQVGEAALTTWRTWMRRLVALSGDTVLAGRFRDLEERLSIPASESAITSPLLHNLDEPIADQFRNRLPPGPVDELWLTAPFFDRDAAAVGVLLGALEPKRVRLFVTTSNSVHGPSLVSRLRDSASDVSVAAYVPDAFVHAKLVGVIVGPDAFVLSGSANLSRAALTMTPPSGNVEMAVLASLTIDELSALFIPPTMTTERRDIAALGELHHRSDPEPPTPLVRLLAAVARPEGRVEVSAAPAVEPGWLLDDLSSTYALTVAAGARATTSAAVTGRLVQLVDGAGSILSNRVVVDDPVALAAALKASGARATADRPDELTASDLGSPLAQALVWLHRNLVLDVSERATPAPAGGVTSEESTSSEDELWDRLEREELARDPRAATYTRLFHRGSADANDPIIELLDLMRERFASDAGPVEGSSLLAHLVEGRKSRDQELGETTTDEHPVHRWSLSARVRVRARNVLRRWASAQNDPRLVWIDPLAPAGNFVMIVDLLAILRLYRADDPNSVELNEADLDDLWLRWLRPFAGTGEGDGWLDHLDDAERAAVIAQISPNTREIVAALCWLLVRPGHGQRERVVACQQVLDSAFGHGLVDPTDHTESYLTAIMGVPVPKPSIDEALIIAMEFIDDPLWCDRARAHLGLEKLSLEASPGGGGAQVRVNVAGILDPLTDPRVPRLVAAVRSYRHCDGVAVYSTDHRWRLVLSTGDTIAYRPASGEHVESTEPMTDGVLESVADEGIILRDLFAHGSVAGLSQA